MNGTCNDKKYGRFVADANCRDQRSRLKEIERIVERYVTDTKTMHNIGEARDWFRILSMITPTPMLLL